MKFDDDETQLHAAGMAALIPGAHWVSEIVARALDELRTKLAAEQGRQIEPATVRHPRRGKIKTHAKSGWPEDPEERKREMQRRRLKAARNAAGNKDDKRNKLRKASKRQWDNMSFKQRKARLAAMQAGRERARQRPAVKMAVAS
jgi:hypothetical protein